MLSSSNGVLRTLPLINMRLYLVLLKLFVISALLIISNRNLALHDDSARELFIDEYYHWLSGTFDKGAFLTGYVVRSEWLPDTNVNRSLVRSDSVLFTQR